MEQLQTIRLVEGTNALTCFGELNAAFNQLAANPATAISSTLQVHYMKQAISATILGEAAISAFTDAHPTLQRQTPAELTQFVNQYFASRPRQTTMDITGQGHALQATTDSHAADIQALHQKLADLQQMQDQITHWANSAANGQNSNYQSGHVGHPTGSYPVNSNTGSTWSQQPARNRSQGKHQQQQQPNRTQRKPNQQTQQQQQQAPQRLPGPLSGTQKPYCWTHGWCGHHGTACTSQHAQHVATAVGPGHPHNGREKGNQYYY